VESTPGQGTTFVITLPRVAAVKSVLSPSTPTPKPTLTGAVLIIDDEPMVRGVLARQMSKAGMRSVPVSGAEEALALLRSGTVDDLRLILLDLSMPDMSGDAALPLLREAAPHVPVIALSGHVPESLDLPGAAAVLQKPIGQRELVAAVAQALG
jgi:CheY-like chemotaxis protein